MQHNPNDMNERTAGSSQSASTPTPGSSGAGSDRLDADLGDTSGDRSASAFSDTSGTLGRESRGGRTTQSTQDTLDQAREQAKDKLGDVKERARDFKATLADKLEAGADKIRQRSNKVSVAEAGADAETRVRKTGSKLASGMESTADWLRNNDVSSMKSGIENQVRTNPGRTLLVTLGVGYVVGRILRGRGGR